jgi:hypothetical protein
MTHTAHISANSDLVRLMAAFNDFDGTVDPAFDSGLDELEREFPEIPMTFPTE